MKLAVLILADLDGSAGREDGIDVGRDSDTCFSSPLPRCVPKTLPNSSA